MVQLINDLVLDDMSDEILETITYTRAYADEMRINLGDAIEDIETIDNYISEIERESEMPKTYRTAKQRFMTKRSAIRSLRNKRSWKRVFSPINE